MLPLRQLRWVVAGLVLAFAVVPRTPAADKPKMPEPEPFGRFTVDQVERRLGRPNVHVYDGNSPKTYAENHLPGEIAPQPVEGAAIHINHRHLVTRL